MRAISTNSSSLTSHILPCLLFLCLWGVSLYSAGGTLVPYRDTGEMVLNGHTLGVAHPPGYPLYALIGKAATLVPLANPAYRMHLVSVGAAALCGVVLFFLLGGPANPIPALGAALLWAGSGLFRELSSVSEMYTLSLLFILLLFFLVKNALLDAENPQTWLILFLLAGLAAGVRTDVVLLAPALLFVSWRNISLKNFGVAVVFGLLGIGIFLYLPLRSERQPWLDWLDPETLEALTTSLLRRSHGSTLDLLSKSYRSGQNFVPGLSLFFRDAISGMTWIGLALAIAGLRRVWRESRTFFLFLAIAFMTFGPLFIYLANMPPNPHALAILEAHFLVPQVVILILAGEGMRWLCAPGCSAVRRVAVGLGLLALGAFNLHANGSRAVKRWNLYARDYATNILRTAPPRSMGVLREDVQLFALWERTLITRAREDFAVLAQGLASSPWYHRMLAHQGQEISLVGLRDRDQWNSVLRENAGRSLWASGDANIPHGVSSTPAGLLQRIDPPDALKDAPKPSETDHVTFYVRRGIYRQDRTPDFFSSDLVSEYSRSALREAVFWEPTHLDRAVTFLKVARSFDPESPSVPFHLGYSSFQQGDLVEAEKQYDRATRFFEMTLQRAAEYRTLPDVVDGLRREAAEAWTHRGVVAERRNSRKEARDCYMQAIRRDPDSAQAHYNLAVTYWNEDWPSAVEHLERAVALAPQNANFRHFYEQALARRDTRPEAVK